MKRIYSQDGKILPKGVQRYYFSQYGGISFIRTLIFKYEILAINDKNALRKFTKLMTKIQCHSNAQ